MNRKTVNASRVFVQNSESDFAHTSTTFLSLTDSNMELGNRKRFSVPNFKLNNCLHQKHFCFKKRKLFFKKLTVRLLVSNFNTFRKKAYFV